MEAALLTEADAQISGDDAWLIIDDTSLPKKGTHSVGVAPQYASTLGKTSSCQTLVSLTLARREAPVMIGLRLFLPEIWTSDMARLDRAKVPEASVSIARLANANIISQTCLPTRRSMGSPAPSRPAEAVSRRISNWAPPKTPRI